MVRRAATQVHKQVTRLTRTGYLQREPLWYKAVLEHPPLPLPPRAPPNRLPPLVSGGTPYDLPADAIASASNTHLRKPPKVKAPPVVYLEDEVRRQFFRDHPFEAFRERTLVEEDKIEDEHPVRGAEWTRLSQRGRNPSPEDAIRFAVNLYENTPGMPLTEAYISACMQFHSLRSEQQIASQVARVEAEHYGMKFKPGPIQKQFDREEENLKSWEQRKLSEAESMEARKRWRMEIEPPQNGIPLKWTKGDTYTRLWKKGIRPDYSPALAAPEEEIEVTEEASVLDFLHVRR